ncbi:hypothetical protein B0T10DRAFT_494029 [Thelonectria olida]|uniref:Uncharacterized protein n=1 Tax=Thelonectria olida TaxID=1576542 RepID=A0A9P9ALW0_9HYPO|nr:hypothetical protein B0T10DRAFT_494029 [Thelonectria olida]
MASASNDKTVRIWSVETGKCEQVLDGHIDCITSVVFSHDSKLVASASHKMVWIWSVETGECQQILEGHSSWVISAVFSHDSKLIASGSVDKTVRIWRMEAGKCEQVLEGHRDSVNLGYTALHAVAGGGHSESETRSNDDHGNHEDDELDYQDWEDEVNVSHPVVMTGKPETVIYCVAVTSLTNETGLPSTLPELVDTIFHTISPISEPAVPLGKTRIRWQCRCGENLFDDFVEVKPGSLMALQARLREMNGTHDSNQERDNSAQQQVLILRRSLSSVGAWIRHGVMRIVAIGDQGANSLPLHSLSPQSQQDSLQNQEVLHLLLCIDKGESLTRLYQERLQGVSGDGELFLFLRYQYYKHRNFASWFTLRCVRNLSLSRFKVDANCFASVHSHGYACTSQCVCLPPVEMVDENEYRCAPAPRVQPDYFPAIGSRELTHYFLKPHTFDIPQRILYNQIPKRACGQLRASQDEAQLGWGLHLQEGWHWRTIYFVVVVLLVTGSFVFGVTWSLLKRDIQGAFAIAGTWLALGPLLLGYIAVRDI